MITEKRNREIFALRECGQSYSQLSIQFGLSPSRIKQICKKEQDRVNAEKVHQDAVNGKIPYTFWDAIVDACKNENCSPIRIFNCLARYGIIAKIENDHISLDEYSDYTLLSIRNFGPASLRIARQANELYKKHLKNHG